MTFTWKDDGKRILLLILASVLIAVNIRVFVNAGGLYPGGATGLTVLIQRTGAAWFQVSIPYSVVNIALNAFPVYIGFRFIGKKFTLYSLGVILLSGFLVDFIPGFTVTGDTLLIAVFGGILSGISAGLCLLAGATTGGTDFISMYFNEYRNIDGWNIIFAFNCVILLAAGLMFGLDKALYSIIYQFVATQMVHTMYQRFQRETLFIVTTLPREVCRTITQTSHHGATILKGEGAYENEERYVVYSVVSREEYRRVSKAVRATDPKAFVNTVRTDELRGRFYHRRFD